MSTNAAAEDAPRSSGQKALASLPIVLTIIATIFAGLSSSEMTRSMYNRSLAGQHQAKAGSQWGFFQAKKMRGTTLEIETDVAQMLSVRPINDKFAENLRDQLVSKGESVKGFKDVCTEPLLLLDQDSVKKALGFLTGNSLPTAEEIPTPEPMTADLLAAIRDRVPESKTVELVARTPAEQIESAIEKAEAAAASFDSACEPTTQSIRSMEIALDKVRRLAADRFSGVKELEPILEAVTALKVARQDFNARRYAKEATYNQQIGELYEVQVRRAGYESERHRIRSKNFFYAMLCAQAGVTIASLALARSKQSAFWLMAGLAGLLAVGIGAYVYLAM